MNKLTNKENKKIWTLYNANLRTKTIVILVVAALLFFSIILTSLFLNSDSTLTINFANINQPPSLEHIFGTDWMGRDMFTRTILGLGISIFVGMLTSLLTTVIAIVLGILSSINKVVDEAVALVIDLFGSIPHILLIMLVSLAFGTGLYGVVMGIGLTHWTPLARVLRAEIKQIKATDYVKLSQQLGKSKWWIAKKHILPLVVSQVIVGLILVFPHAIMHEASISFLGFGLSPHEPAIGIILSEAMKYFSVGCWWLAVFPGLSLLLLVLIFDLIGENVHKLLDPQSANT
ncbi:MAG: ABC transporter permease [Methanosphaera sp.]|uniref:ABC transporter permease n=1 Tax=Methanosphaera sp. TaxID=2666342 RepID=UPI0025ED5C05|nr:ABC transporter permease [Methanosphaera sp.]MCI5867481.1 ABC transporter permease [Methanosphaera sp.]MDD6534451.1 ABC transporter permease [Methanosphaera sp.]MDY3955880.1 ABC transporter permease [Methanosphaera sp.]